MTQQTEILRAIYAIYATGAIVWFLVYTWVACELLAERSFDRSERNEKARSCAIKALLCPFWVIFVLAAPFIVLWKTGQK